MDQSHGSEENLPSRFETMPEDCISNVLSFTTPLDACRSSLVSKTFRSASDTGSVWQRFIPPDWDDIVASSFDNHTLPNFSSFKDRFFYLSDHPFLINGGTMRFSLDRSTGKKRYMFPARSLHITWGDSPQYWDWISLPESSFPEVAKLVLVWWLEIRAKIKVSMLSPDTAYAAFLVFKLKNRAMGFDLVPSEASLSLIGEEKTKIKHVYWRSNSSCERGDTKYPNKRKDGWFEVELGDLFFNKQGHIEEQDRELEMCLKDVTGTQKTGLIVEGIEIRPKELYKQTC